MLTLNEGEKNGNDAGACESLAKEGKAVFVFTHSLFRCSEWGALESFLSKGEMTVQLRESERERELSRWIRLKERRKKQWTLRGVKLEGKKQRKKSELDS